ncbi:MAG: DUF1295 domain-containing protein [Myxococcota bacterium]
MGTRSQVSTLFVAAPIVLVAGLVAWAGGQYGTRLGGVSVMAASAVLAFAVQWIAFVPAYARQTEHFYDLVGSLTYLSVAAFALVATDRFDSRALLLFVLVVVWAGRLGTFLFRRVRQQGSDGRFDAIKPDAGRFFVAWTLQGLWVFLTLCAALAAMTTLDPSPLGITDAIGLLVWAVGFGLEVIADRQKSRFRSEHPGRFVDAGLWAWSRHPNYFGEIVLWTGVAIIASSTLHGWQWVTMVSPVFVAFLLLRLSGVPILERRADERWGGQEDYERYKRQTPVLLPRPPSFGGDH